MKLWIILTFVAQNILSSVIGSNTSPYFQYDDVIHDALLQIQLSSIKDVYVIVELNGDMSYIANVIRWNNAPSNYSQNGRYSYVRHIPFPSDTYGWNHEHFQTFVLPKLRRSGMANDVNDFGMIYISFDLDRKISIPDARLIQGEYYSAFINSNAGISISIDGSIEAGLYHEVGRYHKFHYSQMNSIPQMMYMKRNRLLVARMVRRSLSSGRNVVRSVTQNFQCLGGQSLLNLILYNRFEVTRCEYNGRSSRDCHIVDNCNTMNGNFTIDTSYVEKNSCFVTEQLKRFLNSYVIHVTLRHRVSLCLLDIYDIFHTKLRNILPANHFLFHYSIIGGFRARHIVYPYLIYASKRPYYSSAVGISTAYRDLILRRPYINNNLKFVKDLFTGYVLNSETTDILYWIDYPVFTQVKLNEVFTSLNTKTMKLLFDYTFNNTNK